MSKQPLNIVALAVQRAGGVMKVARHFGHNHNAIRRWVNGRVPAERVLALAEISGVPAHLLRPDIYPAPMDTSHIRRGDNHETMSAQDVLSAPG